MIEYTVRVYPNGSKFWWLNEELHREDGPAIEWPDGRKEWHLNGVELSEEEFNTRMNTKERIMITYYINWMGPINYDWIKTNGKNWCGGRIDVSATEDNPFGDEIGVPIMNCEDWESLSLWLRELKTETIWTLRQIIDEYQKTNPKIRWFNNKLWMEDCDD